MACSQTERTDVVLPAVGGCKYSIHHTDHVATVVDTAEEAMSTMPDGDVDTLITRGYVTAAFRHARIARPKPLDGFWVLDEVPHGSHDCGWSEQASVTHGPVTRLDVEARSIPMDDHETHGHDIYVFEPTTNQVAIITREVQLAPLSTWHWPQVDVRVTPEHLIVTTCGTTRMHTWSTLTPRPVDVRCYTKWRR